VGRFRLKMSLNQEDFSYALYSDKIKKDWDFVRDKFLILHVNAYDDEELIANREVNLIIYKLQKGSNLRRPVGIIVSNGILAKHYGQIRSLDCSFGGVFILEESLKGHESFGKFLKNEIYDKYFIEKLKIDLISLINPPLAIIEESNSLFRLNISNYSYAGNNSIIYVNLKDDYFQRFKKTVKSEIAIGLEYLKSNLLLDESSMLLSSYFLQLEEIKSRRLGLKALNKEYFDKKIDSRLYKCLVCVDLESSAPVSGVIISLHKNIADFEYNSSSYIGRKTFANRALLYHSMNISKDNGAKYFILGTGYIEGGNMDNVTMFKRSMSSAEASCTIQKIPISFKGRLYFALRGLISPSFYN